MLTAGTESICTRKLSPWVCVGGGSRLMGEKPLLAERLHGPDPGQILPLVSELALPWPGRTDGRGPLAARAPAVEENQGTAPQISYCLQGLKAPNNGWPLRSSVPGEAMSIQPHASLGGGCVYKSNLANQIMV